MRSTIDASVFVSAARPGEVNHASSLEFVGRLDSERIPVTCPAIVLPESAAAIARVTNDPTAAEDLAARIESLPAIEFHELTLKRARHSATVAAAYRLRGADSIYVQAAQDSGSTLITLDAEMLSRASAAISVMTPYDWLAANPAPANGGH